MRLLSKILYEGRGKMEEYLELKGNVMEMKKEDISGRRVRGK